MKLFPNRQREEHPLGVIVKDSFSAKPKVTSIPLKGDWWRVFPSNTAEWRALAKLQHRVEKYAPDCPKSSVTGNGVLVSAEALLRIDYA